MPIHIRFVLTTLLLIVPALLLAAHLTGRHKRAYRVAAPDDMIALAGKTMSARALAERYRPVILDDPGHRPPDPYVMWAQVIVQTDKISLVYHGGWRDEQHPHPIGHILYRLYRQAFYGSECDFEYVEIHLDPKYGSITRVRFETADPQGRYDQVLPHLNAFIEQCGDSYCYRVDTRQGKPVLAPRVLRDEEWRTTEGRVMVAVKTWNHVYQLTSEYQHSVSIPIRNEQSEFPDKLEMLDMPLDFLDGRHYQRYKFARRSQGDIATPAHSGSLWLVAALLVAAANGLVWGFFS